MCPLITLAPFLKNPLVHPLPPKEAFLEANSWMVAAAGVAFLQQARGGRGDAGVPALGFHYCPVFSKCLLLRGLGEKGLGICSA